MEIRSTERNATYRHPDGEGALLLSANTLIGSKVFNRKEENLGDIKELMLNTVSGSVSYAVLAAGGFLGMGEKLFAVPWSALSLDTEKKCFVLDVDVDRFKEAPGFDKDQWPNMADATWAKGIHSYYGIHGKPVNPRAPTG
jgi:PRC-barrel domain